MKLPKLDNVSCMTAGKINKALDALDKVRGKLTDEFIATGRGHELPSETAKKTDPLALKANQLHDARWKLRVEIERRYGPGAPSRLPSRGFGPRKGVC